MNIKGQICMLISMAIFVISCSHKEDKMILGKWTGVKWLVENEASTLTPSDAVFTFNEDGSYIFEYAGTVENGKYFVSGNQLFTTPDGGIKMMVKIPRITADTLVFDMNRSGQAEQLTLKRN